MENQEQSISKYQANMNAVMATLHLMVYYGVVLLIWGFSLNKNILLFSFIGIIIGLIIGLVFVAPVMAMQKTVGRTKDMMFAAGALWGNLAIVIGVLGVIVWVIRAIFFH